jgi:glycosyltransferase involved in cell wall biosynthesis
LLAVSEDLADLLSARYPHRLVLKLANPIATIHSGPLLSAPTKPTVVFVGGEWTRKGLWNIAKAVAEVGRRRSTDLDLIVLGKGTASMVRRIADLPRISIEHEAWRPDVETVLRRSSLLALASNYETFAMAAHEALALGLPVVSTPVHGVRAALTATSLGRVSSRSVTGLADAIEGVLFIDSFGANERLAAHTTMVQWYGPAALDTQRANVFERLSDVALHQLRRSSR